MTTQHTPGSWAVHIKFYLGEVSSHHVYLGRGLEEVHVLERVDCVLTVETEDAADYLENALRHSNQSFIRSDTTTRTLVDFNVFKNVGKST